MTVLLLFQFGEEGRNSKKRKHHEWGHVSLKTHVEFRQWLTVVWAGDVRHNRLKRRVGESSQSSIEEFGPWPTEVLRWSQLLKKCCKEISPINSYEFKSSELICPRKESTPWPLGDGVLQRSPGEDGGSPGLLAHSHHLAASSPSRRIRSQPLSNPLKQGSSRLFFLFESSLGECRLKPRGQQRVAEPVGGPLDATLPGRASARVRQRCGLSESARGLQAASTRQLWAALLYRA